MCVAEVAIAPVRNRCAASNNGACVIWVNAAAQQSRLNSHMSRKVPSGIRGAAFFPWSSSLRSRRDCAQRRRQSCRLVRGSINRATAPGRRGGPARGAFIIPPTAVFAAKGGCAMRTLTPVLCTSGLAAEAKVARAAGFQVIVGAGDPRRTAELVELAAKRAKFLISFGVAGGLAPHLRSGQVILSAEVIGGDRRWHPNQRFHRQVGELARRIGALEGPVLGSSDILSTEDRQGSRVAQHRRAGGRSRKRDCRAHGRSRRPAVSRPAHDRRPGDARIAARGADPAVEKRHPGAAPRIQRGIAPPLADRGSVRTGPRDAAGTHRAGRSGARPAQRPGRLEPSISQPRSPSRQGSGQALPARPTVAEMPITGPA